MLTLSAREASLPTDRSRCSTLIMAEASGIQQEKIAEVFLRQYNMTAKCHGKTT
jgi:hypothetical protein